ncbi:leucine aminopeptidase 1 [Coccidioides immitis RS]|uniref:Peptide hydrolase n=3 Tax=Coccidioides immitis TaxID=5501 RepID=A0A0E1RV08_COCIM|nr:leucine aminopeptidase 1 [Coccidioides immitis RS]EAS28883.1 leucine aminopeptidase 1 [Coccidioides immitis RS]KMP06003.1 leupeptin-inactivating enzyme 1 [Coccidioides immitis RMSCC 2394]KMU89829.1 leupeptin-inactivating enzyme 1 [Coccidioides immitis H538.4]TPX22946.1 Leucyl aminopeptidase yscIV [Coccidioides immitis]
MKTTGYLALGAALVSSASAAGLEKPELGKRVPYIFKDLVSHDALLAKIKLKDLEEGIGKLQSFADANGKTRVFGEPGHKATVDYIYNELKKTGYYDVTKQEQQHLWTRSDQSLTIDGAEINSAAMTYSPSGKVEGELVLANNLGCAAEDYPEGTKGKIVVAERGDCSFADKNMMAHAAGASAAIIYNSVPGELRGTLGGVYDNTVPVVGISREDGLELVDKLKAGTVSADLFVESRRENRTTWNVLAQTKRGNAKNVIMLGAHSDSVDAGPGINDNGSGSIALLTIAKALTNFRVHNAVRFGWWTAEEFGLLGSEYYVSHLSNSELEKIRLYMNFDMVGSPNYVNGIYDGDGNAHNLTGPAGSAEIEHLFEKYFDDLGWPHIPTAFTGRSDYDAFIQKKIPAGGLFTGAEVVKTEEQAKLFGGEAGKSFDPNYHAAGDTVDNIHKGAFLLNTRGAAYAAAEYARSTKALPPKEAIPNAKRAETKLKGYGGDLLGMCEHKACNY